MNDTLTKKAVLYVCIIIMPALFLTGCNLKAFQIEPSIVAEPVSKDNNAKADWNQKDSLSVKVHCGLDNTIKDGQPMNISADILDKKNGFEGVFQAIVKNQNGNNVLYEKEVSVPPNKVVKINLTVISYEDKFLYRLVDTDGNIVIEQSQFIQRLENENLTLIGILEGNNKEITFLTETDSKVMYLNLEDIPDEYSNMGSLDILISNGYYIRKLSELQKQSILEWVKSGGVLLLSETDKKSLEEWDLEETFKMNDLLIEEENDELLKIQVGLGQIQIMKANQKLANKSQVAVEELFSDNSLNQMKRKNNLHFTGIPTYDLFQIRIFENLDIMKKSRLPNINLYIFVLFAYVIIIGPILYFFLKRLDKREYTWILVPVLSVCFFFIVYALGSSTRIKQPYAAYLTYLNYEDMDTAEKNTYFSFTSPYNDGYEFKLPEYNNITAIAERYYPDMSNLNAVDFEDYEKKYNTLISQKENNLIIAVKNLPAFTPVYFKSNKKVITEGSYQGNIKQFKDKIQGNITNNLGYDLSHTAVIINGVIVYIGDLKNTQTISLNNQKTVSISSPELFYQADIAKELSNDKKNKESPEADKEGYAVQTYIENSLYGQNSNYIIGVAQDMLPDAVITDIGTEAEGIQVVIMPIDVDNTQGELEYIPDLDRYGEITNGKYTEEYTELSGNELEIRYQFPDTMNLKSILYEESRNHINGKEAHPVYSGNIWFYDKEKKKYEEVFINGQNEITNLTPYLGNDNCLLVKYQTNDTVSMINQNILPVLSGIKEAA